MRIPRLLLVLAAVMLVTAAPKKAAADGLFTMEPTSIDYGTVRISLVSRVNQTVVLHNAGNTMLYVFASLVSGEEGRFGWMCVSWAPCQVPAGGSIETFIQFSPNQVNKCWNNTINFQAYNDRGYTSWVATEQVAVTGCGIY